MGKETKELISLVRENGFKVVTSGKHFKVYDNDGRPIVDANGPLMIAGTPGDHRNWDNTVTRFRRAGVLPQRRKENHLRPQRKFDQIQRAKANETLAKQSRERQNRTRDIRSRIEPIVAKVGGWEKRGVSAQLAEILFHTARSLDSDNPKTLAAALQQVAQVKTGKTLSDKSAVCWEITIDQLEQGDDPVSRWFTMYREAKHLPNNGVTEVKETEKIKPVETTKSKTNRIVFETGTSSTSAATKSSTATKIVNTTPDLAIRAVAHMMRSRRADIEAVIAIGKEILAMELNQSK